MDTLVGGAEVTEQTIPTSNQTSGDILVSDDKGVRTVTLNRPAKYNAITVQVYIIIILLYVINCLDVDV